MKTIVTYTSKTGFTKQYAQWIAQEIGCDTIPQDKCKDLSEYDFVIHGGWIMGGMINGLDKIRKLNPKNLVIYGVGFTQEKEYINTVKETNHVDNIPTFYFLGGFHPKKLNFFLKKIVKAVTKKPVEEVDISSKELIYPLIELIKSTNIN